MSSYQSFTYMTHEQALRVAEDTIAIGKKEQALLALYDYIMNPKRRGTWTIVFEKIMTLFINLCLELDKPNKIKDGIIQYRYMSQQANISSLEAVIQYYRDEIEKIFEKKIKVQDVSLITDLDQESTPEELFLFSLDIEGKKAQDELKSNLNLLWNCYKSIIEIVKINNKLEDILVQTLEKAYKFCLRFNRKVEFKRLCGELRMYLLKMVKSAGQVDFTKNQFAIDVSIKETNNRFCEIYLEQLNTCMAMGLWQDAFKTVEDIHEIILVRKGYLQSRVLSEYFEKLSIIFWHSQYYLYHGLSFHSHYNLYKKYSKASDQAMQNITDKLVLSILSIPPVSIENDLKPDNQYRICTLISSSGVVPTRNEMINLVRSLLDQSSKPVKELFWLLERDFNMMTFQQNAQRLLSEIQQLDAGFVQFIEPIQNNLLFKTIKSASHVFKTLKFETLNRILYFAKPHQIEQTVLVAQSHSYINVKINHEKRIIIFNENLKNSDQFIDASQQLAKYVSEVKTIAGKITNQIQQNDSEYLEQKQQFQEELQKEVQSYLEDSKQNVAIRLEQIAYLKSPEAIKKIKQTQLIQDTEKIQKENLERLQRERDEFFQQELQRKQIEQKKIDLNKKKKLINEILKIKGGPEAKISGIKIEAFTEAQLETIDESTLKTVKEMIESKSKLNVENKHKRIYQKADYLMRARREEEQSILQKQLNKQDDQQAIIDEVHQETLKKHQEYQKLKLELNNAIDLKNKTCNQLMESRKETYEKEIQQFKQQITDQFKKMILDRAKEMMIKEEEEEQKQKEEKRKIEEEQKQKKDQAEQQQNKDIWRNQTTIIQEKVESADKPEDKPVKEFRRAVNQEESKESKQEKGFTRSSITRRTDTTSTEEPKKPVFQTRGPERPTSFGQKQQENKQSEWRTDIAGTNKGSADGQQKDSYAQKDHVSVNLGGKSNISKGFTRNASDKQQTQTEEKKRPMFTNQSKTDNNKKDESSGGWRTQK